jgi:hypothetical protein
MTRGFRIARAAWLISVGATIMLTVFAVGDLWNEARATSFRPEYFKADRHFSLSPTQAQSLQDIGLSPDWHAALVTVRFVLVIATSVAISALIWRRARTWAPLFLSWFLLNSVVFTAFGDGLFEGLPEWLGPAVLVLLIGGAISMMGLLLVFPDDRSAASFFALLAGLIAIPVYASATNNGDAVGDWIWNYGLFFGFGMLLLGLVLQVARIVKSRDRTGRDLLVLTVVMLAVFVTLSIQADGWSGIQGSRLGLGSLAWRLAFETVYMAIPLAYGLAVLWILVRRGHWDMDVQLKGSVGYAGLTTSLVLAYFAVVALVQAIVNDVSGTAGNTFALMVSTAVIAAAFLPARARLQALVDRIFDRRRRDAEQMVEAFESELGRESHPHEVASALTAVVDNVFRPEHVDLWVAPDVRS